MEVGTLTMDLMLLCRTRILRDIRLLPRLSFSLELSRQISPREVFAARPDSQLSEATGDRRTITCHALIALPGIDFKSNQLSHS